MPFQFVLQHLHLIENEEEPMHWSYSEEEDSDKEEREQRRKGEDLKPYLAVDVAAAERERECYSEVGERDRETSEKGERGSEMNVREEPFSDKTLPWKIES